MLLTTPVLSCLELDTLFQTYPGTNMVEVDPRANLFASEVVAKLTGDKIDPACWEIYPFPQGAEQFVTADDGNDALVVALAVCDQHTVKILGDF